MGTTKPPSPTTDLSALRSAASKLSSLSLVQGLLRIAPGLPAAALAGVAGDLDQELLTHREGRVG